MVRAGNVLPTTNNQKRRASTARLCVEARNAPAHCRRQGPAITYDSVTGQQLDIYVPAKERAGPHPVIVFAYGGRWQSGSREEYAFVGHAFAKRGYVVVIPDYRQYPAIRFPAFVEDVAAATAWTTRNIASYGGDPDQLNLIGHSAGAQIMALIAADPRYLKAHNLDSRITVRRVVGLSGPYDFIPEAQDVKAIFPPESYHDMKVTSFITGKESPMLLLHGDDDTAVATYNHERLAKKILTTGGQVKVITYPKIDHIWIIGALTWFSPHGSRIIEDIDQFLATPN